MQGPLHVRLLPVRRRQQWLVVLKSAVVGLLVASVAAALLGLGKGLLTWPIPAIALFALIPAGPIAGGLLGLLRRPTWSGAAHAVDAHYHLKDRTTTVLAFLSMHPLTVFQELEIADALKHLGRIDPREVAPCACPRSFPMAVAAAAVAVALLFWPGATPEASAGPAEAVPGIVAEAEHIGQDLKDIEQFARREGDDKLVALVQELQKKVEEMKQPGVALREAMAKISEIQSAIAQHAAELNTQLVDDKLKDLGEAMASAGPLEKAGKALQDGDHDKAAKALESCGDPRFEEREAKATSEKMNRVSQDMKKAGLRRLGEAARRMSAGIRGEKEEFKEGARDLAQEVRQQERRKRINELLSREQERLTECKNQSQKSYLEWMKQQRSKDGKPDESKNSGQEKEQASEPTPSPGNGPGDKQGNKRARLLPDGEKDKLPSRPDVGDPGERSPDGSSPKGSGKAMVPYREQYQQHRREMEAALEREPIPIGQREAIRRYFDLIRPADGEAAKKSGE